jgi:hypothetical protein
MIDSIKNQLNGLPPGFRVTAPLAVSVVAIGVAVVAVARAVGTLGQAAALPGIDESAADPLAALATESDAFLETSRRRFDGRSVYTLPPPPVRKPVIVERPKPVEPPPPDPGPPPPPATYTGPAPTSVIGDVVAFGSIRIRVGESSDGIKVLSVNAPYSVEVEHMRGTYTVPFWTRFDERLLRPATTAGATRGIKAEGVASEGGSAGGINSAGANQLGIGPGSVGPNAGVPQGGQAAPMQAAPILGPNGSPKTQPVTQEGRIVRPATGQPTPNGGAPGSGLPSPAMEPQEVPPPGFEPPEDEPASEGAGVEYVDRAHLPPRRSDEQIAAMTIDQAREALAEIDETANWSVDSHNRARMNHERVMLLRRINGNS